MKRICTLALCIVLLFSVLPMVSYAEKDDTALRKDIYDSCLYNQEIDISQYDITVDELHTLFYEMLDAGDLPWYTDRSYYHYEYDEETDQALSFAPRLLPDYKYNRAYYQRRLEEILQECVREWMEPWQIALALHDYLIIHAYYDETLNETTGYDLLRNGRTVCSGYTEIYRELMNMAGVPCKSVVSEPMLHTWNLVQLDGRWYHVDLTWDDPVPDTYGYVSHKFFLLTDEEIAAGEEPHHDWKTDIKCFDKTYTKAFWRDVDNPILFTDADSCYLVRQKNLRNVVYQRTLSTGQETEIYKEEDEFLNIGKGSYRYQHYGLSIWNDRLWVGTMTKVLSMNLKGKNVRTEFTYNGKKNKRYIAGFYADKDYIRYLAREHNGDGVTYIETLEPTGYHIHKYTETIVEPTCGVPGYTLSECSCGIQCQSSPTAAREHAFSQAEKVEPTFTRKGAIIERCANCGEERSQTIPRLTQEDRVNNTILGTTGGAGIGVAVVTVGAILKAIFRKKKKAAPSPVEQKE